MQDLISWNDSFETGLATVDEQHKQLVRLANKFGAMLLRANDFGPADIDNIFVELANYAKFHFAEEERLMGEAGLPEIAIGEHRREHQSFVEKVGTLWMNRQKDPERTFAILSAFLQTWICKHILVIDKEMARQVRTISTVD